MNPRVRDWMYWAMPRYAHSWPGQAHFKSSNKHSAARKQRFKARHKR